MPFQLPSNSEVDDLYSLVDGVVENILRFDVPVNDSPLVEEVEGFEDLMHDGFQVIFCFYMTSLEF